MNLDLAAIEAWVSKEQPADVALRIWLAETEVLELREAQAVADVPA